MSELAAAGAALLAAPDPVKLNCHQEQVEINQEQIKAETDFFPEFQTSKSQGKISNLAVPENDSISSSEDENEDVFPNATSEAASDFRAKTLQPKSSAPNSGGFSSSLKRSFTLPRHPLFNLTNSESRRGQNRVKKAKRSSSEMKSDLISSPSKSRTTATSVRNLLTRVVKQISAKTNGGSNSNKCDRNVEERIAEWKRRFTAEPGRVPGVIGIRNHGNTCFINAILQCLSYTDILAEYFVLDVYKGDLKRKKKLQTLTALYKRGSGNGVGSGSNTNGGVDFCGRGEVTEQLATLLKSLWSLQYDPEISVRFKSLVEKHASQYKGGSQHDAQEFLLWLLDRVHEDLNMASGRLKRHRKNNAKFDADKEDQNPTDEVLAAESLANYMRSNNSFVMDVFQAQFRSSLTCPSCDKQSNTFDPFLCVSLPIPQKQMMPVFVTVLYIDQTPRQVKLGVSIGVHETIGDLRTMLSNDTGIEHGQILLAEIDDLTFRRTFKDSDPVSVINEKPSPSCDLFCIEVLKHKETTEDDGAYILVTWVNVLKEGPIEKRFGSPYTIQVSREILYEDLQKLLMKEMASILHDDILIANQKVPLFNIRVLDGLSNVSVEKDKDIGSYLDASVELPMYTLAIEQAIALCSVTDNVPHVKFTLEWDAPAKSQIIADDRNPIEEHFSVKQVAKCPSEATSVSLKECFGLYTKAEKLGDGDAWFCPECKRKQEVVKKMGLWSLPDVLIIHLKRFRQTSNTSSNKLSTMVECPLEGYDMSPFVTNTGTTKTSNSALPSELQQQRPQVESSHTSNMWTNVFSSFKRDTSHKNSSNQGPDVEPMSGVQISGQNSGSSQPQKEGNEVASETTTASANFAYDLYAVCNHHGDDLQGGHYTATCRNPTDGHWYSFDDIHTSKVDEPDVVSADAYILFYQKQSLAPNSSSTSSASSSSSSNQEHWVYRMPDFSYKNKTTQMTKAQTQSTPNSGSSTSTATSGSLSTTSGSANGKTGSSFARNSPKYATMPTAAKSESNDTSVSKKVSPSISGSSSDTSATVTTSGQSSENDASENKTIIDQSETKSLQCEEMQQHQDMGPRADSSSSNNHEDVSRPIDKNDVD